MGQEALRTGESCAALFVSLMRVPVLGGRNIHLLPVTVNDYLDGPS
jgi:hypothetical protein